MVERYEDFEPAFERAWRAQGSALIELRVAAEAITPRTTLSALRAAADGKRIGDARTEETIRPV